ncbi:MAG TPA: chromosome partitioning protein [Marmoricola sp.]|nr:chromosome partitioning protein [Marmoricola sp.]
MELRDRTSVLVAAGGAAWEVDTLGALESAGVVVLRRCVDLADLLATATAGQASVAVVAGDLPGVDADAVAHLSRHGVRVVAVVADRAEGDRLLRLGAAASVVADEGQPAPAAEVARAVATAAAASRTVSAVGAAVDAGALPPDPDPARPEPLADTGAGGRVIAVWGPTGAPGRSTVAATLAAVRATTSPCVLVDADAYGGAVAQMLGILDEVSGLLAAARLANAGALDSASFATCRRRVGERLDVLTGLPRADRWVEVRAGVLERILDLGRAVGDVVVDAGFCLEDDDLGGGLGRAVGRNQLTLDAVAAADEVLVVGAADPVGLSRLARGLMELRERVHPERVRVVVNRMRDTLGWREQDIRAMVEGYAAPVGVHFLPEDRTAVDRALVGGRSLTEVGDGPLRRAVGRVADQVFAAAPTRPARGR